MLLTRLSLLSYNLDCIKREECYIKQALTDYAPALTEAQKEALSWLGLKDAAIAAWQNLSDEEKASINDTLTQIKNT